jgi:hypothetical protein
MCIFLHSLVTSSLFGPNILLRTLFSNTLSLCSSLNVLWKPYVTVYFLVSYSLVISIAYSFPLGNKVS